MNQLPLFPDLPEPDAAAEAQAAADAQRMTEADEVSQEDLEAAAELFDRIASGAHAQPRPKMEIYRVTRRNKSGEVEHTVRAAYSRIEAMDEAEQADKDSGKSFYEYGVEIYTRSASK